MHAVWTCVIIYGTEEPVPPWQAPLPITKWSGGGWDLERKCPWKAVFLYVADFWFLPCPPVHVFSIQNEHMRSERKEKICGEQLSSPPLPLMPACLPVPGSSGVWVWERFPSFPGLCLAPVSTAWVWVFEHTFIVWGFAFILSSRLATRAAEVSGGIVDTSGLSRCPEEGAVVSFSSSPPSIVMCGCMLNCFGSHPWSRALVQVPGDCCGEVPRGVAYRAWMEAKGCTETAFCSRLLLLPDSSHLLSTPQPQIISSLFFLSLLSSSSTQLPEQPLSSAKMLLHGFKASSGSLIGIYK